MHATVATHAGTVVYGWRSVNRREQNTRMLTRSKTYFCSHDAIGTFNMRDPTIALHVSNASMFEMHRHACRRCPTVLNRLSQRHLPYRFRANLRCSRVNDKKSIKGRSLKAIGTPEEGQIDRLLAWSCCLWRTIYIGLHRFKEGSCGILA